MRWRGGRFHDPLGQLLGQVRGSVSDHVTERFSENVEGAYVRGGALALDSAGNGREPTVL